MFDAATAALIRAAPTTPTVDPGELPQLLTQSYVDLTALRLRVGEREAPAEAAPILSRLSDIATLYEGIVDRGSEGEARRAAAFVAATAFSIQSRFMAREARAATDPLTPNHIDPAIAAPLLFLVAEQSPDAREAGAVLLRMRSGDVVRSALIETVADLVGERFEPILQRGERLGTLGSGRDIPIEDRAARALYGLCWRGLTQLVARLLDRELPPSRFLTLDSPGAAFRRVVDLSTDDLELSEGGARLVSGFAGPRHLARLLLFVADSFEGSGVVNLPPPAGVGPEFWRSWTSHRAKTKPVLWQNHRKALATGFHEAGRSAVLSLPTGAGKTTLSEVKIAATLGAGKKTIFLVPTLALVDQLRDDLAEAFPENLVETPSTTGDLTALAAGGQLTSIEVMTPERCLAVLSFAPQSLADIGLIVFDECHLLTPRGGGKRSVDAMLCLLLAVERAPGADLLLLSAMLSNQDELASWIAELTNRPCEVVSDPWKPSRQARGVVVYRRQDIRAEIAAQREWATRANVARRRGERGPRQPTPKLRPVGLFGLQHNWHPDTPTDIRLLPLTETALSVAASDNPIHLTPNANKVAVELAKRAVTAGIKTMVFVQNATHAPGTARSLAALMPPAQALREDEAKLWDSIQRELGAPEHSLVSPTSGALPHNADMIALERRFAELRFRRPDGVGAIVASPTLAQGMNLPAQLAILAGDKRHGDDGREPLEAHEIINAAGRAGRAGFLANGMVILIPEPIVGFTGEHPEVGAFGKLRELLPPSDACLDIVDPLTQLLDRIQAGDSQSNDIRYLLSRITAGKAEDVAPEEAVALARRSLYAYRLRAAGEQAHVDATLGALRIAIQDGADGDDPNVSQVAAFTGLLPDPLFAAQARLLADPLSVPQEIPSWLEWIIQWLQDDPGSRHALLGSDDLLLQIARGKKTGGPITAAEFDRLLAGLIAWISGRSFATIEIALGVRPDQIRQCGRSRDLALKLANRSLYIVAVALTEIVRRLATDDLVQVVNPAVLDTLAIAVRLGLDRPEKVAFQEVYPAIRSRVALHDAFNNQLPDYPLMRADTFADLLRDVRALLAFLAD